MKQFKGLYVPPILKKGVFVFFAADNIDFAEDTPDGKNTAHGTITAVYQKKDASGECIVPKLCVDYKKVQSLTVTPHHTPLIPCPKPKSIHLQNELNFFTNIPEVTTSPTYRLTPLGWAVASAVSRMKNGEKSPILGCAGYHSILARSKPVTDFGALPLLPEIAHDWSTLLTVVKQAMLLKELALGQSHAIVITFDMALYEKVVQLVDSHPELKGKVVPRLGELHVVMSALRALGSSIENSGIDDAWIESGVYGSATTRQILKCTHYKRSLLAHIHSYMALYDLKLEQFFTENPDMLDICQEATCHLEEAITKEDKTISSCEANDSFIQTLTDKKSLTDCKSGRLKNKKMPCFFL